MRTADCGIRPVTILSPLPFSNSTGSASDYADNSAFRIPQSAFESPARLNDAGYLSLKCEIAKSDTRNTEFAKVPAGSARLRTAVANTDRAAVPGHFLQLDHRRVYLFRCRSRIVNDLFRR